MASALGLVAGIAMAQSEGVPQEDQLRIALVPYVIGLTPVALLVTQTLARNAVPPRVVTAVATVEHGSPSV